MTEHKNLVKNLAYGEKLSRENVKTSPSLVVWRVTNKCYFGFLCTKYSCCTACNADFLVDSDGGEVVGPFGEDLSTVFL